MQITPLFEKTLSFVDISKKIITTDCPSKTSRIFELRIIFSKLKDSTRIRRIKSNAVQDDVVHDDIEGHDDVDNAEVNQ